MSFKIRYIVSGLCLLYRFYLISSSSIWFGVILYEYSLGESFCRFSVQFLSGEILCKCILIYTECFSWKTVEMIYISIDGIFFLGISHPEFYGDVIYKLRKILGHVHFENILYKRIKSFIKKRLWPSYIATHFTLGCRSFYNR